MFLLMPAVHGWSSAYSVCHSVQKIQFDNQKELIEYSLLPLPDSLVYNQNIYWNLNLATTNQNQQMKYVKPVGKMVHSNEVTKFQVIEWNQSFRPSRKSFCTATKTWHQLQESIPKYGFGHKLPNYLINYTLYRLII